jgi:hypothetical protein
MSEHQGAPLHTYVFVRADLPLADQVVQVGHACLEAGRRFEQPPTLGHVVVLSVPSQRELLSATARVRMAGIRCLVFSDPDLSILRQETAACSEPVSADDRRVFRRFSMWRAPRAS